MISKVAGNGALSILNDFSLEFRESDYSPKLLRASSFVPSLAFN
jgi:hypothetical protein